MTAEEQLLEEERLRREQESYPVARAPVYAGSPAADIDSANAAEPMQRSYVEPGQEARGFIAADVGPTGNVLSGSYDSAPDDFRALQAHEAAMRYKGMQTYRSLLQGGATPAEAYRLAGADLNFSNPAAAVKMQLAMQKAQPKPPKPLETMVKEGITFMRTPTGGWTKVHEEDQSKVNRVLLKSKMDSLQKDIERNIAIHNTPAGKAGAPTADERTAAARRVIAAREEMSKLEAGYLAPPAATATAPMPPSASAPTIQKSKDGFSMIGDPERPRVVTTQNPEGGFTISKPQPPAPAEKVLTADLAREFLKSARGNRAEAEKLAREAGFTF